jgi:asparagine synthetase B (glutamine-hydrolysing)
MDAHHCSSLNKAARVAVLYSGGIDSTMIAFLANRYVNGLPSCVRAYFKLQHGT